MPVLRGNVVTVRPRAITRTKGPLTGVHRLDVRGTAPPPTAAQPAQAAAQTL